MSGTQIKSTLWKWSRHYAYGAFAKSWNGAFTSVDAFLGVAVGATIDPQTIQAPNWRMIAYVFGVKFATGAIRYFSENPLPPSINSNPPFPPRELPSP